MFAHFIRGISRLFWVLIITALLIMATYASLGRYYIRFVEDYQSVLVERFASAIGMPVSIKTLYGRWQGLSPVIGMEGVRIMLPDSDRQVISLARLEFRLNPLVSLLEQRFQVSQLTAADANIQLQETAPGQWRIVGNNSEAEADLAGLLDLLLSVSSVDLKSLQLNLVFYNQSRAVLSVEELMLERQGQFRRLSLEARFAEQDNLLSMLMESRGDPRNEEAFTAGFYLELNEIDFSPHLPAIQSLGVALEKASLNGRLWGGWSRQQQWLQGELTTPYIDLAALSGRDFSPMEDVQLSFRLERTEERTISLWLDELEAGWYGRDFRFAGLKLGLDDQRLAIQIPDLDLATFREQILATDLLPEAIRADIQQLAPTGALSAIAIELPLAAENFNRDFSVRAIMGNVGLASWKAAPAVANLSGYLQVQAESGLVDIDSQDFSLALPTVYSQPLLFTGLKGQLGWKIDSGEKRLRLRSGLMDVAADLGPARASLELDLPLSANAEMPPEMVLQVGVPAASASVRDTYIPDKVLPDTLQAFLADSILAGEGSEVGFIYRGSLRKTDNRGRTIQLAMNVRQGRFDYASEWPIADSISGQLYVDDGEVDFHLDAADYYGLQVERGRVSTRFEEDEIRLEVDAALAGAANDGIRILGETALRNTFGNTFDRWEVTGAIAADFRMQLLVTDLAQPPVIDLAVQLNSNGLTIPQARFSVQNLEGVLNYTSARGLFATGLNGRIFSRPVSLSIDSAEDSSIEVAAQGKIGVDRLVEWLDADWLFFADGVTDYQATLSIGKTVVLAVTSDLQGVALDLPEPFTKTAAAPSSFNLVMELDRPEPQLQFQWADQLSGQVNLLKDAMPVASLTIGSREPTRFPVRQQSGIYVSGRLSQLNVAEWQQYISEHLGRFSIVGNEPGAADSKKPFAVKVEGLQVAAVDLFGRDYADNTLSLAPADAAWMVDLSNSIFDARILLPSDQARPIQVGLRRLLLAEGENTDTLSVLDDINLQELPELDIRIDQLAVGTTPWGRIAFQLRPREDGLDFTGIEGALRGFQIGSAEAPAKMAWRKAADRSTTAFQGTLAFSDLAAVLKEWNYESIAESRRGTVALDIRWDGRPDQWSLAGSEGLFSLDISDGRFLNASQTASGALKVISILNFTNILRRIQFDFSDLLKEGFSYDGIKGSFELAGQRLVIRDAIQITSPSSRFRLLGSSNLQTEALDMEMIATLPVASNLPWIAAIVGGLPTAAGVYVASKVFEKQVDRVSSVVYAVEGTWDEPEIKFRRIFNDKSTIDDVLDAADDVEGKDFDNR